MRILSLTTASVAALAVVAADTRPAAAQVVITGGYYSEPGYYVSPAYYGGGYVPVYQGAYTSGYGSLLAQPAFGSGYGYPAYYGGYRTYSGYSNYGGSRPVYTGGYGYRSYGGVPFGGRRW
jgi:hypothetical protein